MACHVATWPPRCTACQQFMSSGRSEIERVFHGHPFVGADDMEYGVCMKCENNKDRGDG